MNLTELIVDLQNTSGRLDLSTADLTKFLNQGVKFLDEISGVIDFPKMYYVAIAEGDNTVVLPSTLRNFKSVYRFSSAERIRLAKSTMAELREVYNTLPEVSDTGSPMFYAPISVLTSDVGTLDLASFYSNWANLVVDTTFDINALMLYPAADAAYSLEVIGNFYTAPLTVGQSENLWSVKHPELLISAAMFKLDVAYRNTMGAKELLAAISLSVNEIYHDKVEYDLSDQNLIMEG